MYVCIHDTKLDTKTTCPLRPNGGLNWQVRVYIWQF